MKLLKYISFLLFLGSMVACQHDHSDSSQNHDRHDHGPVVEVKPTSSVTVSKTIWTDNIELFVEFPALIVGQESMFAAHFTWLEKHKAVESGTLNLSLGNQLKVSKDAPVDIGIFNPVLIPKKTGIVDLIFELNTEGKTEKIVIENVEIFNNEKDAYSKLSRIHDNVGDIEFLKEQAWKIDFGTFKVKDSTIYSQINTAGKWQSSSSDNRAIVANSSGIVQYQLSNMTVGTSVKKGQILAKLNSQNLLKNNLNTEIRLAKTAYETSKVIYDRKKKLFDNQLITATEMNDVERTYLLTKDTYETIQKGGNATQLTVLAPFSGYIKQIESKNGGFVEEGDVLFNIGKNKSSILEVYASPSDVLNNEIYDIQFISSKGKWMSMKEGGGYVQSVNKLVTKDNPQVSIYAQMNSALLTIEGSFVKAQLIVGDGRKALIIPEKALLENYGNYTVMVQVSGESFEKRDVKVGNRNGSFVEILSGISKDEIVVTEGVYQIKMASMSGEAPAHGHAH